MRRLPATSWLTTSRAVAQFLLVEFGGLTLPEDNAQTSYVYFARAGMAVKIGRTANVRERCRALTLQRGTEHRAIVAISRCGNPTEKAIHRYLAGEKTEAGETFRGPRTEELLATLCEGALLYGSRAA